MAEDAADLTDDERGLLAGAATGSLDADETARLQRLLERRPGAAAELAGLRDAVVRLEPLRDPAAAWREDADPALVARVLAATSGAAAHRGRHVDTSVPGSATGPVPALVPAPRAAGHRRAAWYALAAMVLLLVGGLGGAVLRGVVDPGPGAVVAEGAPGTLGAREPLQVRTASADVTASAAVVAHTWGTETFLDVEGLPVGETYQVVVVDEQGNAVVAGTFIGSEKPVVCVMNAAVLRPDATRVEVLDPAGTSVVTSDLPTV